MDRFDVAEGYWLYYAHWHRGGLTPRYWEVRRRRGIASQLIRMHFRPAPSLTLDTASEGALCVYRSLVERFESGAAA